MSEEDTATEIQCSFCEKSQSDVFCVINGPGENICNECVVLCHDLVEKREFIESSTGEATCSFCSKTEKIVNKRTKTADAFICAECVDLGSEIVEEKQWRRDGFAFCSFWCRKTMEQVSYVVMGPKENICSECVRLFGMSFDDSKPIKIGDRQRKDKCAFCGGGGDGTQLAGIINLICSNCLDNCKREIEENSKSTNDEKP